jgi:hypothetical protein
LLPLTTISARVVQVDTGNGQFIFVITHCFDMCSTSLSSIFPASFWSRVADTEVSTLWTFDILYDLDSMTAIMVELQPRSL